MLWQMVEQATWMVRPHPPYWKALCTSYRAETDALMQAAYTIQTSDNDFHQVVFM